MLSISKGFSVDYLTRAVAEGREGYYSGAVAAGEPPGQWYGAGAAELGLTGEVDGDLMEAIYSRLLDPRDEAAHSRETWGEARALARGHRAYRTPRERYEEALAAEPDAGPERRAELEAAAEQEARQAVAFEDATFTATKSVSLLAVAFERAANDAARAGRYEEAASWRTMHKAVEDAVMAGARASADYLQDAAGYARVGNHAGGAGRWMDSGKFIVAQFLQHDSRERDPNLHVHQAILNRIHRGDGGWGALDGTALRMHRWSAGAIGERVAEAELARTLGVAQVATADGLRREVAGVSQELMETFSKRSRALTRKAEQLVAEYEKRHGREASVLERKHIAQQATLLTRKGKSHDGETAEARLDRWEAEASGIVSGGLGGLAHDFVAHRGEMVGDTWSESQVLARALDKVGEKQGTWSRSDLIFQISSALPANLGVAAAEVRPLLEGLADKALAQAVVVLERENADGLPVEFRLANDRSVYQRPGSERYTTPEQVRAEQMAARAAVQGGAAKLTDEQVDETVQQFASAGKQLFPDQEAALRGVATSGAHVETLSSPAGSGKTFVLGAIAKTWGEHGGRTIGLTAAQRAADVLVDAGVNAFNFERWRGQSEHDEALQLREGDLVVVDEASMASTQDIADIVGRCEEAGAKLLLTGDERQLRAVGPGGAFADLGRSAARYELTDVRRFAQEWEGEASLRLRDGDPDALRDYDKHGRLRGCGTAEQTEQEAGRAWLADTLAGKQSLLMTSSNDAAARMSAQLRARLVDLGRVAEDGVELGRDGTVAGVGDVVRARRNNWNLRIPVINQQSYRVVEAHEDGSLRVESETGDQVTLPARYVSEHLSLAYASTVHSAQGLTVDTAHGVVDCGGDASATYVAATRGRESNTLWVTTRPQPSDAPVGEVQEVEERSARAVLADSLTRAEDDRGALAEQAQAEEDARSELRQVDRLLDGIAEMTAGRTSATLDRLAVTGVITTEQRQELAADQAMGSVDRLLRHAEVAGHQPDEVLREALEGKSLAGSRSVGKVLHARVRTVVGQAVGRLASYRDLIPAGAPERWRTYLGARADAADARREELGARVAAEQPQWATETLGPVPEDPEQRAKWQSRAGWAAAHRENTEFEDDADPLGAAPPAGLAEKHAIWCTAHAELDLPDVGPEEGVLTDGRLLNRVAAHEREKTWAPRWVADELAATSESVAAKRTDAELWAARAATLDGAEQQELAEAAEKAAREADELEMRTLELEEADRARAAWYLHTAVTRDKAERAKAELGRRGVDLAAPPDATTATEWLAADRADREAEDEYRPIQHSAADDNPAAAVDDTVVVANVAEADVAADQSPVEWVAEDTSTRAAAPEVDDASPADSPETAAPDLRDVAVRDVTEDDPRVRREVPVADDSVAAVQRAREALLEIEARDQADQAREADETGDRAERWLAAPELDDTDTGAMVRGMS